MAGGGRALEASGFPPLKQAEEVAGEREAEETAMEVEEGAGMETAESRKRRLEMGMVEYVERYFYQYRDRRMPTIVSAKQSEQNGSFTIDMGGEVGEGEGDGSGDAQGQQQQQQMMEVESSSSSEEEDETLSQNRRQALLIARQMTLRSNLLRQVAGTLPSRQPETALPMASRALRDVLRRMSDVDVLTHHLLETSRQQLRTRTNLLESSGDDQRPAGPQEGSDSHRDPHR